MLTPRQTILLNQVKNIFSQIEQVCTSQQLDQFQQHWFTLNPSRDIFKQEQQQLSLERQRNFRATQQHQGL
jgi:hypothetical protein